MLFFGAEPMTVGRFKQAVNACCSGPLARGLSAELANQGVEIDQELLAPNGSLEEYACLFQQGIECQVLPEKAKGWQPAKLRIQVSVEIAVESEASAEKDTACWTDTQHIEDLAKLLERLISR